MRKSYRTLSLTFIIALLTLGVFVLGTSAEDLSPPYMIILHPWSEDATVVAVDTTLGYAYIVANKGIAVFHELTRVNTIDIGAPRRVGVDAVRGYVYVTRNSEHMIVITATTTVTPDTSTMTSVAVGRPSDAIAVMTTTGYAYITLPGDNDPADDYIAVLKGITKIGDNITVGDDPKAIAANSHTGYVYVANKGSNSVSIISGTRVVATLTGDFSEPSAITINPVTGYVYICNNDGTLTIVQGTTVVERINFAPGTPIDRDPIQVAVNSKTGRVYVGINYRDINNPQGWLEVLSGTIRLNHVITMSADVRAIAINENSGYVYVSTGSDIRGRVTILSDTIKLESFPMGQTAPHIAINDDPKVDLAYVPIKDGRVAIFGRTPIFISPPLYGTMIRDVTFNCLNVQQEQNLPITITVPAGAINNEDELRVLCIPLRNVEAPAYVWGTQGFRLGVAYEPTGTMPSQYAYTFTVPLVVTLIDSLGVE